MARAATWPARLVDFAILGLVGLTGPFSLVFLPLFAWRWWRERNGDTLAALVVQKVDVTCHEFRHFRAHSRHQKLLRTRTQKVRQLIR